MVYLSINNNSIKTEEDIEKETVGTDFPINSPLVCIYNSLSEPIS